MLREDRLGTAQADLRRARDTGRTGSVEVDVVGGITGLILGVLVTNVFVTTQGRAVVLTWASVGLDLAYSLLKISPPPELSLYPRLRQVADR